MDDPDEGIAPRPGSTQGAPMPNEPAPLATPAPELASRPLAGCEVVVAMRFSFFGTSGWQSAFSKEKALLFDADRLQARLRLFEALALASLAAQGDRNLHLFVLTSADLPDWARARLQDACLARLGEGRFTIAARPPGPARRFLRMFLTARHGRTPVVQVVLDDDDALAVDFMQRLRPQLAALDDDPQMAGRSAPHFLSFVNGYGLVLPGGDPAARAELYLHRYPYINLGLTMISQAGGENLFSIDHRNAPRKHGCRLIRGAPMFVRTVHGLNDSRVAVTGRWTPQPDWQALDEVRERFPYLLELRPR
jgi:hypothetical protein